MTTTDTWTTCPFAASVIDPAVYEFPDQHHHADGLHRCTQQIPAGGDHLGEHTCRCGVTFIVTAADSPSAPQPAPGLVYLLWSQKRNAWWRPDARGYTSEVAEAGRFSEAEAVRKVVASAQSGIRDKVTFMVAAPDNWQSERATP